MISAMAGDSLGVLGAGDAERRHRARRRHQRSLAVLLGTFLGSQLLLALVFLGYVDAVGWTEHTDEVRLALEETLGAVLEAQSAVRGYLLTGDPAALEPYGEASLTARETVASVERLTGDNPVQRERVAALRSLVGTRLDALARSLRLAQSEGPAAALPALREGADQQVMKAIRELVARMTAEEADLRDRRSDREWTLGIVLGVLTAALTAGFGWRLREGYRRLGEDHEAERRTALRLAHALAEREGLLAQRDMLLREVNHRVKNSLQLVSGLLALQARQVTDLAARRHLLEMRGRIDAIVSVHRRLYTTGRHDSIALGGFVRELCEELGRAGGRRVAVADALGPEAGVVPVEQAVPLGLIVNELVTNALKHAFPGGSPGTVTVGLRRDASGLLIEIADDGVGLPEGMQPEAGGFGMRVVAGLVTQLGGRLEVRSGQPGTCFAVSVPESGRPQAGEPEAG